ncbi:MAG: PIG-L family deacetylase [Verrucomicrobiae bacterium]|nr:PIG-L family deacetylase [Verrucomicrobiae bacterium]
MKSFSPRILALGAHPDDCEILAGGSALLWARKGAVVKFVSVTNGECGHHAMSGSELVARRRAEAKAAAEVAGIESLVMDHPDGKLVPGLAERESLMRVIRGFRPDLILTHRPNDYHPDHRYTSQLVQDCAYVVGVPNVWPELPPLREAPVIAYFRDNFQKPTPFQADVVVDIGPVISEKIRMLACHESQFFEWLPWNGRHDLKATDDPEERLSLMEKFVRHRNAPTAEHRSRLATWYGADHAAGVEFVECFEACEYGAPLDEAAIRRLFAVPASGA